jgi:hypothetical protein
VSKMNKSRNEINSRSVTSIQPSENNTEQTDPDESHSLNDTENDESNLIDALSADNELKREVSAEVDREEYL